MTQTKIKGRGKHYEEQFVRTQANKIRKIEKELKHNPNNASAKKALEFWKTVGRRVKRHRKKAKVF